MSKFIIVITLIVRKMNFITNSVLALNADLPRASTQSLDRTVYLMVEPFSSKSHVKERTVFSKLLEFTCCLHSSHSQ